MICINILLRRKEEIIQSHVEQMSHLTPHNLERKLKEKGAEIVRLINEEESLRGEQRELENKLMEIEDMPCFRELEPNKQGKQGTIDIKVR